MDFTDLFGFGSVGVITAICYLVAQLLKATPLNSKLLPVICGAVGGVIGLAAMFIMPDYPASDYITAVAVGVVSGLAATGCNQIYQQLTKED